MERPSRRGRKTASALVAYAWAGRVEAEYRSAAQTQELTLWLLQIGASPDLVRDGLRIVEDELTHAELSRRVWVESGGDTLPVLDRASLGLGRTHDVLELDVCAAVVRYFCLGETVAVRLFSHLRKSTTVQVAKRALDRILEDEVRHRQFGWTSLEWLLQGPLEAELRAQIDAMLPTWIRALERAYGDDVEHGIKAVTDEERAWGVAPWREYADILHRTYATDYRRRFERLAIAFPARA
ncbi:MAG: ferritin-like domain-containing protein [Polyangiaceae bacterium]